MPHIHAELLMKPGKKKKDGEENQESHDLR